MTATLRLLRFVIRYEIGVWRSLYRWVFRRPEKLGAGDQTFSYVGAVTTLMWIFIILSAVEIPIFELMLPWETVRKVALGLGIYGLLWMFGLLASNKVHPHVVGDAGLRVRQSVTLDLTIPWASIETVRVNRRSMPPEGQPGRARRRRRDGEPRHGQPDERRRAAPRADRGARARVPRPRRHRAPLPRRRPGGADRGGARPPRHPPH
ncbi:hypothetical protein [Micromonospora thermarum]|uniref:Integral membrane protein n=1 Tax=Micromonospora thermarum TaxID=2720024 RepID=A0ABX0Z2P3_9ACTN|nr:hypothetical protein [Micromonospora thermarum]NJP32081.1 hypothetical protein [Micromonospora thermarum]